MKRNRGSVEKQPARDLIAIGSSAGGTEALQALVAHLPPHLPAALLVAQHASNSSPGMLPAILARAGPLAAALAIDGEPISHSRIYVAPPDHHLIVKHERLCVSHGPRESNWRPCVDTLFRSVAVEYSNRAIGVVLSGLLYDGTAGLKFIKRCGGLAVVQEPQESAFSEMPRSALANVDIDYRLSAGRIGLLLGQLAGTTPPKAPPMPANLVLEASLSADALEKAAPKIVGNPVTIGCPECGGPLRETGAGELLQYRCHVGHSFSPEALVAGQHEATERALWVALRTLEERASMLTILAQRSQPSKKIAQRYEEKGVEARAHADVIRSLLLERRFTKSNVRSAEKNRTSNRLLALVLFAPQPTLSI